MINEIVIDSSSNKNKALSNFDIIYDSSFVVLTKLIPDEKNISPSIP